jgi:hypothetical protein
MGLFSGQKSAEELCAEQIERYETLIAEKEENLAALEGQNGPEVEEARQKIAAQIMGLREMIERLEERQARGFERGGGMEPER